ncbi:MAG: VWA domain-containing protein [Halodesulfurarchaeum sp.]
MSIELDADIGAPFTSDRREAYLEVTIEPRQHSTVSTRNVCLLVDTSTSMSRDKISRARDGVSHVLDELQPEDRVSIIGFDTRTNVVLGMTRWEEADQQSVYESVTGSRSGEYDGELEAAGGTRIPNGLEAARDQFSSISGDSAGARMIVFLSDGKDQRPIEEYESLAREINDQGISIAAAGIGSGYEEEVILTLARESGGEPFDLDSSADIEDFLGTQVREASKVVADNPTLRIDVGSDFALRADQKAYFTEPRIVSRPLQSTESGAAVELPRLKDNTPQELTLAVLGTPNPTGVTRRVAELAITERGRTLASTTVETVYRESAGSKRPVEKRRNAAKVITEMSDGDATEADIEKAIAAVEKEGWSNVATDLKERFEQTDDAGGEIEITKQPLDRD